MSGPSSGELLCEFGRLEHARGKGPWELLRPESTKFARPFLFLFGRGFQTTRREAAQLKHADTRPFERHDTMSTSFQHLPCHVPAIVRPDDDTGLRSLQRWRVEQLGLQDVGVTFFFEACVSQCDASTQCLPQLLQIDDSVDFGFEIVHNASIQVGNLLGDFATAGPQQQPAGGSGHRAHRMVEVQLKAVASFRHRGSEVLDGEAAAAHLGNNTSRFVILHQERQALIATVRRRTQPILAPLQG
mmetsp:Transcript_78748/g.218850  ORF Transcript_78748/g.218850 Transcript_78748/m.218850 type:complete len:244 (-) Transcript_78748:631-1362(-)